VIAWSPDGSTIAAGDVHGGVEILHQDDLAPRGSALQSGTGGTRGVSFSPDGKYLVSANSDGTSRIWSASTYTLVSEFSHGDECRTIAISESGRVAVGGHFRRIDVLDLKTGRKVQSWPVEAGTSSLDWNSDGTLLASGHTNANAFVWEVGARPRRRRVGGHSVVHFLDDGSRLATYGGDLTLRIWHVPTGRELGCLYENVRDLAVAPGGKHLYALMGLGNYEMTIAVWPLR
jgi:WD40 repeat protein